MEKQKTNKTAKPLSPLAHFVLAGVAFGIAYVSASAAINTGRLLEYFVTIVLAGLGIKNLVQGYKAAKNERSK